MRCNICSRVLNNPDDPFSKDCGGDCLACMADAGDPDCVRVMEAAFGHPKRDILERLRDLRPGYGNVIDDAIAEIERLREEGTDGA